MYQSKKWTRRQIISELFVNGADNLFPDQLINEGKINRCLPKLHFHMISKISFLLTDRILSKIKIEKKLGYSVEQQSYGDYEYFYKTVKCYITWSFKTNNFASVFAPYSMTERFKSFYISYHKVSWQKNLVFGIRIMFVINLTKELISCLMLDGSKTCAST